MADVPGDTSTTASIGLGGTLSGNLDFVGDHDWFRVTLTAGQTYTISVTGSGAGGLVDSYLNIYDSSGTSILASNDDIVDGTNRNSLINFTAPTSGTYYLDVGAFQNQYTGAYQLSVQPYVPPPVATLDQIADQLVNGFWGGDAHHFNVTQGGTVTVNISTLNSAEQNLARKALAEWSDIIGVTFKEVTSGEQITFDNSGTKLVAATDADWVDGIITHAHVHISSSWVNNYGTGLNTYSFQTYIHEIGHALGLGHAGDYNNTATYPNDALFQNDAWSTSIMSYFDQQENTYFGSQGFSRDFAGTPMGADILAIQTLYGLSSTTRTGNSIYGFNTTVGGIYDASQYPRAAYTIFDSGGNDTLDFSGSAANQLINLNPEAFSNVDGQTGNLSIARGVVIENAIGGGAGDTIIGNYADNVLTGNGGSDTLTGGAGNDTFRDTRAGHNGDTITDLSVGDKLVFSDATLGSFGFNLSGHTLTYDGGSLTFANLPSGTLVASSAAGGGVQIVIAAATIPTPVIPPPAHNDFNGDGRSDILWRSDGGYITDWLANPNGSFFGNSANFLAQLDPAWKIAGTGDFNGDGRVDILWRHDSGIVTDWLASDNGGFFGNSGNFLAQLDASWQIVGTGDFNGDGRSDILWRHSSGLLTDWLATGNGGFFGNSANFAA
ncbi:MAG: M10 family metallopeptidase C-terminal domain-containing protein, partial [Rhizomicrobium sp.]